METCVANFILAPSNRYVGWVVYNNGYFFGSGDNLTRMLRNIKLVMYKQYGKWKEFQIVLANKSTPKDYVPVEKMSNRFKSASYFAHKTRDRLTSDQTTVWKRSIMPVENIRHRQRKTNQPQYLCKEVNGEMVVYEIKEVARYKMFNREDSVLQKYLKD